MIKYVMHTNHAVIVGLGLSNENIKLLMLNKPIHVKLQDLGITDPIEIMIHWGPDEKTMAKLLVREFGEPGIVHGYDGKEDQG